VAGLDCVSDDDARAAAILEAKRAAKAYVRSLVEALGGDIGV